MEYNFQQISDAFAKIGYTRNLIKREYEFTDFLSPNSPVRKIDLSIFGQEPLDYRSACFGVHYTNGSNNTEPIARSFRSLGASQFFLIINGETEWWINTESSPIRKDSLPTRDLPNLIKNQRGKWNPDALIRLKSGALKPGAQQLDFVDLGLLPALENEASEKTDALIIRVLSIIQEYEKSSKTKIPQTGIFNIIFQLLTAKLLKDRNINSHIDFSQPLETLNTVQEYYQDKFSSSSVSIPPSILKELSAEIGKSFSFRNLSVDSLTYVYENTLVTSEARKERGIHSTPPYLAEYILRQIPFEEIPRSKWKVGDVMCGQGIFLIAAMRRMRGLLPNGWQGKKRHNFFTEHLTGADSDQFATQVAKLCLTLADFPESDGWNIRCKDVFENNNLEKLVSNITILVGNPPFEVQKESGHDVPKPALLLSKAIPILTEGSFLGIILPRSFLDGSDYKKERQNILKDFEIFSITTLPDKIFKHADSETAIVIARKTDKPKGITTVYREVRDQNRKDFEKNYQTTWENSVASTYFINQMNGQLIVPFLKEVWDLLQDLPTLENIADIRIGVQYEPKVIKGNINDFIKEEPFENSSPAITKVTNHFLQFSCEKTFYIATMKELHRRKAWQLDWTRPKVVVPSSGMSRFAWRYAAVLDRSSRIATRNFYCIWPKISGISVETIAAVLNAPVAQALVYSSASKRNTPKRIYQKIPIPHITSDQNNFISSLVDDYIRLSSTSHVDAKDILLQIDAEILKLYALPPRLEKQLLDIFWGKQRPVPFEFKGYYPADFKSWIPLHIYLSHQYQESTPKKILERIPTIEPGFIEYLKTIGTED